MGDTVDTERIGYNKYEYYKNLSYNIISYLMKNNELIWKLLKYNTADAWSQTNLTLEEKGSLIYDGSDDSTGYHVFLDEGNPDVHTREDCIIRVSPMEMYPENKIVGTILIGCEVYAHYKVNTLSDYTTRVDTIVQEFLTTLNGVAIDGVIGNLSFDRVMNQQIRQSMSGQTPFKGKIVYFGQKTG